jgi:hypothetical protein
VELARTLAHTLHTPRLPLRLPLAPGARTPVSGGGSYRRPKEEIQRGMYIAINMVNGAFGPTAKGGYYNLNKYSQNYSQSQSRGWKDIDNGGISTTTDQI